MITRAHFRWSAAVIAVGLLLTAPVHAQNELKKPGAAAAEISEQDEAAALAFAKEHHPELAKLLGPMKARHPKEYHRALRELSRASDRLARMQSRSPERYSIELDLWKAESRLRLASAKSAMTDDDERREQIEKLVTDRNSLKLRLLEFEKAEAEQRLAQVSKQIEALKAQEAESVRKEVDRLVNSAKSSAKRVRTKLEKPADALRVPGQEKPKNPDPKRAPGTGSAS
ncbi:MAG TPA: hypothetical protein VM452_00860 [Caulifigura sp.]|jgi:hypothetical protein|nr:hypothetical protein [Caulifigura sp.]